jgi:hypothetical protein
MERALLSSMMRHPYPHSIREGAVDSFILVFCLKNLAALQGGMKD